MLRSLHISNFAIIKDIEIEFGKGVTIFTGETGAGKSILVDALSILAGKRAKVELIRTGENFFCIEGIFSIDESLISLFSDFDVTSEEDDVVISRRMNKSGKSTCTINGFFCSVKKLEEIGRKLFRFHEQYDNTDLLTSDFCRKLVDSLNPQIRLAFQEYTNIYLEWKDIKNKIELLNNREQEYQRRLDVLLWESSQIKDANICIEEDEKLEKRLEILQNAERIKTGLQNALNILVEENGVQDKLAYAEKELFNISKYGEDLSNISSSIEEIGFSIEDIVSVISNQINSCDFSDEELDELNRRDEMLKSLMRKFGPKLKDVVLYYEKSMKEIDEIQKMIFNKETFEEELKAKRILLDEKSQNLFKLRSKSSTKFCDLLSKSLKEMSIKSAKIEIKIIPSKEPTITGVESMEIYFSANEGESLKPMRYVASGGELSRISLAIETITSSLWKNNTMIFDEIDMGISGKVAVEVASKLKALSENVQILCITHLPQTASIADEHYNIQKIVKDGRTVSVLKKLNHDEHLQNIAFMISGTDSSKSALDSAKEIEKVIKNDERGF